MTPISEADPEVKRRVEAITGPCVCGVTYKQLWKGHESDPKDPRCLYHNIGEEIAALARDVARLRRRCDYLRNTDHQRN